MPASNTVRTGEATTAKDVDVVTATVIRRPRGEVAAYAGDPTNAPEWYATIASVEWQTPPPVGIGSRMDFVVTFLGRRPAYTYEVIEMVPGERLVMRTDQGPFPMERTYTRQALDADSTRMTLRNRDWPVRFSQMVAPVMAAAVRRANRADLAKLRTLLEQR
jgi:hypothetical protein